MVKKKPDAPTTFRAETPPGLMIAAQGGAEAVRARKAAVEKAEAEWWVWFGRDADSLPAGPEIGRRTHE